MMWCVWCGVMWCVWCGVALCANVLDCFDAFTAKEQVSLVIYCFSSVSLSVSLPVHTYDCQVCLYAALLALYSRSMLRLSLVNQSARLHITCSFPRSIGALFLISIVQICCLCDNNMSWVMDSSFAKSAGRRRSLVLQPVQKGNELLSPLIIAAHS